MGKSPRAIYQLGLMHLNGNLVARDEAKGIDLVQKAAEASHPSAQFMLGLWLFRGINGFAKDLNAALAWFKVASNQKDPDAMNWMGLYAEDGLAGTPKDLLVALDWYRKSAELRNANASYSVGRIYIYGLGVERDFAEGVKWLRRAALFGDANAVVGAYQRNVFVRQVLHRQHYVAVCTILKGVERSVHHQVDHHLP